MKSLNKHQIIGYACQDAQYKEFEKGAVCNFSIATNEYWIDGEKEKKEHTEWHNIVAWNKLADFAAEYLQKGQLIYIEGKLQTRTYKDKDNVQHWKTEVVSNVITPLEWKTAEKKENGLLKNESEKVSESKEEELPF